MPVKEIVILIAAIAIGYYLGSKGILARFIPG